VTGTKFGASPLHTLEYEQKDRLAAVSPKSNLVF
jgi:hypothetical protein